MNKGAMISAISEKSRCYHHDRCMDGSARTPLAPRYRVLLFRKGLHLYGNSGDAERWYIDGIQVSQKSDAIKQEGFYMVITIVVGENGIIQYEIP